jgi:hypothetical protein
LNIKVIEIAYVVLEIMMKYYCFNGEYIEGVREMLIGIVVYSIVTVYLLVWNAGSHYNEV